MNKRLQFDEELLFNSFYGTPNQNDTWKVIIADDEKEVHTVTKMVLKDVLFDGKKIEFISAYSGEETKECVLNNPDAAVLLIDVVMERDITGLEVIKYIRDEIGNKKIRIVLRTGQAGQAPEREVIDNFDINDYKQKTDLTAQKLYSTLTVALRGYRDLMLIEQSQEKINLIKLFLHNILESMPSALIVLDNKLRITLCNNNAISFFDDSNNSVTGKSLSETSSFLNNYENLVKESFKENEIKAVYNVQQDNGCYSTIMVYPFQFNGFNGVVLRIDDVTETVARDEQIRRIQKLDTIGTLAAGLAHDFNNILGGISGAVSLMKIESPNLPESSLILAGIETVDESVIKASSIVKKLLTISKQQNVLMLPTELNSLTKSILSICEKSLDKSIIIESNFYSEKAYINGDASQIEQVILNLCINAGHAMTIMKGKTNKWGGLLKVTVEEVNDEDIVYTDYKESKGNKYFVIEISDTGIGIDESLKQKIFDPFFTTKPKDSGTGLGLSMVYNTVTQHEGFIILQSQLGEGSKFRLYFPKIQYSETENTMKAELKMGTGTILVVDDDPSVNKLIKKTLEICGYNVFSGINGVEALDLYTKNKIDLVITDNDMPILNGVGLYWKIKEINPNAKILFMTGLGLSDEIQNCIDNGALGILQKPFDMNDFSNQIYNLTKTNLTNDT